MPLWRHQSRSIAYASISPHAATAAATASTSQRTSRMRGTTARPRKYAATPARSWRSAYAIALCVAWPSERVLRDQRVEHDDRREGERERVREQRREREPPRAHGVERDARERDEQQHVLPGLNRGERVAADAGGIERVHRRVVEREPDDEDVERDDRAPPDGHRRDRQEDGVDGERECRHRVSRRNRSRL